LCVVRADLSPLNGTAKAEQGLMGKTYWRIVFSIEIHFGLTEFKARLKWTEDVGSLMLILVISADSQSRSTFRTRQNSKCVV